MGANMWLLLVALSGVLRAQQTAPQESETVAQEFRRIGEALYAGDNDVIGSRARLRFAKLLEEPEKLAPERRIEVVARYGTELLEVGEVERSIEMLEDALRRAKEASKPGLVLDIHRLLALAYLRQAENENCIERHNESCCIFPLRDDAIHTVREPAEKARQHYLAVLRRKPDDLEARWLLNLTAMALGEYPDGVPEEWRFPEGHFDSDSDVVFPRWIDIAPKLGIDAFNLAGGVAVEDYDGDGWTDILTSTCDPLGSLIYYRNGGDGTFTDLSESSGVSEQLGGLNLISGDYDNDGDPDALVLRGAWLLDHGRIRKSLLRNDGGKKFVDVTRAAGLAEPAYPTQAGLFADFDDDGWLDLYVGDESRVEVEPADNYPAQFYRSRGDGTFEERAKEAGVTNDRYAKGVTAGDYDDDGDLDLYVSNIGLNRLYRNEGDGTFEDVAEAAGVMGNPERHFAPWFFDYDNDGRLDLWVPGYAATVGDLMAEALGQPDKAVRPMLFHNRGDGTFTNVAAAMGLDRPFLPMGSNFGDVDNDGWLDIYLGTGEPTLYVLMPNVLLRNDRAQRWIDVTGPSGTGHLQKGHGVGVAAFDHDGDQDLYHQLGGFYPVDKYQNTFFLNPGNANHWLHLDLVGTKTNRMGIGARIEVVVDTPAGKREIHRAAGMVSSFGGSTHRQEIGLGDATKILSLEIRWPTSKTVQTFDDVPLDSQLRITEGEDEFERIERKTIKF